jgi:RimJ/RimL family protein N-acetyltransferase
VSGPSNPNNYLCTRRLGLRLLEIADAPAMTRLLAIGFGGPKEMPHVGYWIGRPHWNQGYATEAVLGLIEYARWLGIPALQADTFPNNPASSRVLMKAGFHYIGQVGHELPARGGHCELNHYEMKLG